MGPARYNPALRVKKSTGWFDSYTADVYSLNADCNSSGYPYNTLLTGYNNVKAGSDFGHPCTHNGDLAW
jgi:hypothetical protein